MLLGGNTIRVNVYKILFSGIKHLITNTHIAKKPVSLYGPREISKVR
jgi:hypothetical protein